MRTWIAMLVAVLTLPLVAAVPVGAGRDGKQESFVARAVPFPVLLGDIYYTQKGSCLEGIDGVNKVSEPFRAPAPGILRVYVEGLSGDWDIYVLGTDGRRLAASENAQVLDGSEGEERLAVALKRDQRVQMVACNWLGELEVTVHFDFESKKTKASKPRRPYQGSSSERAPRRATATHEVEAVGGPITPFWEWDPSELDIVVKDKVVWLNETTTAHHVTPYGGPWKNVDAMHLPYGDKVGFVFRKPGEYLYRCDFVFAGVEHSVLVGDECIGMCGRIVVKKRR